MNDLSPPPLKRDVEFLSNQASLALKAGRLATFEWDLRTDICIADPLLRVLFNLPEGSITGSMMLECIHPNDRKSLDHAIERTLVENVDYDTSFRVGTADDFIWIGARGRVVERGPDGAPLRMMGVNWDMTEVKRGEERQKALTREMDHRVNNGYAIIKSIVAIGAQEYDCDPAFENLLRTQIHALASAHQLAADFMLHDSVNTRAMSLVQVMNKTVRTLSVAAFQQDLARGLSILPQSVAPLCMLMHHICMTARTDMPVQLRAVPVDGAMAEITWISGDSDSVEQSDPQTDFLFSLCIEQLNGLILSFANAEAGQKIVFRIPVLNAFCRVHDGHCSRGDECELRDMCGYTEPGGKPGEP